METIQVVPQDETLVPRIRMQVRPTLASLIRQEQVNPQSSSLFLSLKGRPVPLFFSLGSPAHPAKWDPSHPHREGGEGQLGDEEGEEAACPLASTAALEAWVPLPLLQGAGAGGQALAPCPGLLLPPRPCQALQPVVVAHAALQLVNPQPTEV